MKEVENQQVRKIEREMAKGWGAMNSRFSPPEIEREEGSRTNVFALSLGALTGSFVTAMIFLVVLLSGCNPEDVARAIAEAKRRNLSNFAPDPELSEFTGGRQASDGDTPDRDEGMAISVIPMQPGSGWRHTP